MYVLFIYVSLLYTNLMCIVFVQEGIQNFEIQIRISHQWFYYTLNQYEPIYIYKIQYINVNEKMSDMVLHPSVLPPPVVYTKFTHNTLLIRQLCNSRVFVIYISVKSYSVSIR